MNNQVKFALITECQIANLTIDLDAVEKRWDEYIRRYFSNRPHEAKIIEAYFANAAISIALLEGKKSIDAGDAKAAIFAFCLPTHISDTCRTAGETCLKHYKSSFILHEKRGAIQLRRSFRDLLESDQGGRANGGAS